MIISAGITGGNFISREDLTADLSGFGLGEQVIANSYDGFTAIWKITNVICNPSDGPITVKVTADGKDSNVGTITADNTAPELTIIKPLDCLYFLNKKLIPLAKPFIIGPITIEINAQDSSGIEKAEFYIDNELEETDTKEPFSWYINKNLKGEYKLDVRIFDYAGNKNTMSKMVRFFNLFIFG